MQNYFPTRPNQISSTDFDRPLPAPKDGFKYILSIIDVFSKYIVLYPLRPAHIKAVINKLNKDHFPKYRRPSKIITDQGTQFTSPIWFEFLKEKDIQSVSSEMKNRNVPGSVG